MIRPRANAASSASLQRFRYGPGLAALYQRHDGNRVAFTDRWSDAHRPITRVRQLCAVNGSFQRSSRLAAGLHLALRMREVSAVGDRLTFSDLAGALIDENFRELPVLRRVDGKLEVSVIHFVLAGNRLPQRLSRR